MCGIVTVFAQKNATKTVLDAYRAQAARGSDGFGFVSYDGKNMHHRRSTTYSKIAKAVESTAASMVMFHHRLPTSTPNVAESNHPIKVENSALLYTYYVVHNGIISNDRTRRVEHERLGFPYTTRLLNGYCTSRGTWYMSGDDKVNDSEALAIDLALFIEGKIESVKAEGSAAYCVVQTYKNGTVRRVYYGRNSGNTLYVGKKHGEKVISSQDYTKRGALVTSGIMYELTSKGHVVGERKCVVPQYDYYGGYYGNGGYESSKEWEYRSGKWVKKYEPVVVPQIGAKTETKETRNDDVREIEGELESVRELIAVADEYLKTTADPDVEQERQEYLEQEKELMEELADHYTKV